MRDSLNNYWRKAMEENTEHPVNHPPAQRMRPAPAQPKKPGITLYFSVGLRRFPLLQSHEVTPENVVAAVEQAAKLMAQQEAR